MFVRCSQPKIDKGWKKYLIEQEDVNVWPQELRTDREILWHQMDKNRVPMTGSRHGDIWITWKELEIAILRKLSEFQEYKEQLRQVSEIKQRLK